MSKPTIEKLWFDDGSRGALIWQCGRTHNEQALLVRTVITGEGGVIEVVQDGTIVWLNVESIPEFCKILRELLSEPDGKEVAP